MKKLIVSALLIISVLITYAQTYKINFIGTGAATTVDSVIVYNLSQCISLALSGSDTLSLVVTVGINENGNPCENSLTIYPNPSSGNFSIAFVTESESHVCIDLYDLSGNTILQQKELLQSGHHTYQLSGLGEGIYLMKVRTDKYLQTAKLISHSTSKGFPVMKNSDPEKGNVTGTKSFRTNSFSDTQNPKSIVNMPFHEGDTLKLTGKSGIYKTVVMLFPTQNQTVNFQFVDCTDVDNNHYAVVQIGSQLWMEENLKATKYRDGSSIPNVTDSAAWANLTTGAWCDFHNLPEEGEKYGHLYNFYAVDDSRKMCPNGWHVPSHSEWNIMEKFLDSTVDTTALMGTGRLIGRILKEGCNTRWAYMDSTYGLNPAGFTALCANFRSATGAWSLAPDNNHDDGFWTSTSYNTNSAWFRSLRWCYSDIYVLFPMKKAGDSVRCIKDSE